MAKFATKTPTKRDTLLGTTGEKTATHEGGIGFVRQPRAELYVTAISTKLEPTFYESASERESRLRGLVHLVTVEDPEWVLNFVGWLRRDANMRSVAILVAAEFVKARLEAKLPGMSRQVISAACLRADEPGEFIAYWQTRNGRNLPMPVKRGVADAARKLYNERAALRYDGGAGAMRLGDVVELTHPAPSGPEQSALFGWLLDRRHKRRETPAADLALLKQVTARTRLNALPIAERHAFARRALNMEPDAEFEWIHALAGQWEWGKSWLGEDTEDTTFDRLSDADQWKLFIHNGMGYMALLRNLRNFDDAKISEDVVKHVKGVLADEDEVKRSRQFPFRFYSAFKATNGNHWAPAISAGLQHSLANVPSLGGNTLILADMSGSMWPWGRSEKGTTYNCELAALFASALALRSERATLVQYGSTSHEVKVDRSKGVLEHMGVFQNLGGTQTMAAVREHFRPGEHTRVVIVTDEQAHYDRFGSGLNTLVPESVHCYTWNLGGYRAAHAESGPTRHTLGGLTDQSFKTIPLTEMGVEENWPWET
ncbi:MAG TPA: TROVE domain-containing protein [Actinomycetes bacterium]|nr:TROVE domain-containing protein [Actinomycetes bacterium]